MKKCANQVPEYGKPSFDRGERLVYSGVLSENARAENFFDLREIFLGATKERSFPLSLIYSMHKVSQIGAIERDWQPLI